MLIIELGTWLLVGVPFLSSGTQVQPTELQPFGDIRHVSISLRETLERHGSIARSDPRGIHTIKLGLAVATADVALLTFTSVDTSTSVEGNP